MNSRCHSAALTIVNFISVATNAYGGNELNSTRCLSRSGCGSIADGMLKTRFEPWPGTPAGAPFGNCSRDDPSGVSDLATASRRGYHGAVGILHRQRKRSSPIRQYLLDTRWSV